MRQEDLWSKGRKERAHTRTRIPPPSEVADAPESRTVRRYKMHPAHEAYLKASQDQACACCRCDITRSVRGEYVIDHDHVTGDVRGLICRACNITLGHMGDQEDAVKRRALQLVDYLTTGAANTKRILDRAGRALPVRARTTWMSRLARMLWIEGRFSQETDDAVLTAPVVVNGVAFANLKDFILRGKPTTRQFIVQGAP